jgi:hypothetical protein
LVEAEEATASGQRNLRLSVVEGVAGPAVTYAGLAARVRQVVRGW